MLIRTLPWAGGSKRPERVQPPPAKRTSILDEVQTPPGKSEAPEKDAGAASAAVTAKAPAAEREEKRESDAPSRKRTHLPIPEVPSGGAEEPPPRKKKKSLSWAPEGQLDTFHMCASGAPHAVSSRAARWTGPEMVPSSALRGFVRRIPPRDEKDASDKMPIHTDRSAVEKEFSVAKLRLDDRYEFGKVGARSPVAGTLRWHAPGAGHLSGWERDAEWVGADAVGG